MAWLTGWDNRKSVTLPLPGSLLADVPCQVWIDADGDMSNALATGADIRVTSDDGETLLYHQFDYWTGGGGSAVTAMIRVRIVSLSAVSATKVYVYWGKADAADAQSTSTWRAAFKSVHHLGEASGTAADSTANGHTGTFYGNLPNAVASILGNGQSLDGDNDYVEIADSADFAFAGLFSLVAWLKPSAADVGTRFIHQYDATTATGFYLGTFTTDDGQWVFGAYAGGQAYARSSTVPSTVAFTHVVGVRNAVDRLELYINGVQEGVLPLKAGAIDSSGPVRFGVDYTGANDFAGVLAEIWIMAGALSVDEILYEFNQVTAVGHGLTWGGEESAPTTTTTTPPPEPTTTPAPEPTTTPEPEPTTTPPPGPTTTEGPAGPTTTEAPVESLGTHVIHVARPRRVVRLARPQLTVHIGRPLKTIEVDHA